MAVLPDTLHRRAKDIGGEWKLERTLGKIADESIRRSVACRQAIDQAFDKTIAAHWELPDFNRYYKHRFFGDQKPPLLGLTPLRKRQIEALKQLILSDREIRFAKGEARVGAFELLCSYYPQAISLFLAHAVIHGYDYSRHSLYEGLERESGMPVAQNSPESFKNRDALAALLDSASNSLLHISWAQTASAEHRYNIELFLAHAGLTKTQARPFAKWIFRCWKEYGLPKPSDADCGAIVQERMLAIARSSISQVSRPLVRSVSRPPGAYVCKGALHFINDSDLPLLSPDLREALHDEFHFRQKKFWQAQVDPPYIRLDASETELELIVPPQKAFSASTDHWEINGVEYPLEPFNPLAFSVAGVEKFTVRLIRTRQKSCLYEKCFPLNILSGKHYWFLVDDENRRVIFDDPDVEEKIDLHPGAYHLLLRPGVEVTPQPIRLQSLSSGEILATLQLDADPESDDIPPTYYLKAPDGSRAEFHVQQLPEARVTGGLVLHSHTVDIYSDDAQLELNIQKPKESMRIVLDLLSAGESKSVQTCPAWTMLSHVEGDTQSWRLLPIDGLKPGLNETRLRVFEGEGLLEEILFDDRFYFWSGLTGVPLGPVLSENDEINCSLVPVNWNREQSLGFSLQENSTDFRVDGQSLDKMARLVFLCGGREVVVAFERKGIFLELLIRRPGKPLERQSLKKGAALSLEDRLFQFLRIYNRGANWLRLFIDGEAVTSPAKKGWIEIPLTQLRQMGAEGKTLSLQVERESPVPILSFNLPRRNE